jgi:uncharacterized membrane protein
MDTLYIYHSASYTMLILMLALSLVVPAYKLELNKVNTIKPLTKEEIEKLSVSQKEDYETTVALGPKRDESNRQKIVIEGSILHFPTINWYKRIEGSDLTLKSPMALNVVRYFLIISLCLACIGFTHAQTYDQYYGSGMFELFTQIINAIVLVLCMMCLFIFSSVKNVKDVDYFRDKTKMPAMFAILMSFSISLVSLIVPLLIRK